MLEEALGTVLSSVFSPEVVADVEGVGVDLEESGLSVGCVHTGAVVCGFTHNDVCTSWDDIAVNHSIGRS